jgi:hypothetical protein
VLGCGILVALGHHNGSKTRLAGCNGDVFGLVLRLHDAGPLADLAALRLDGAEHDDHYSWFLVVLAH